MRIIFSKHALTKLTQRNLSREFVIQTLKNPSFILPGHESRERVFKKFRMNYLEVVFVQENKNMVVITAHWVAKVKRKK